MKKLITLFTILFLSYYSLQKYHNEQTSLLKNEIKTLKHQNDSLYSESSSREMRIQRYEYVLDRCNEELSDDCKDHLNNILNQTE